MELYAHGLSDENSTASAEAATNPPRVYPKKRGLKAAPEEPVAYCARLQRGRERRQVDLGVCVLAVARMLAVRFAEDLQFGWRHARAKLALNKACFPLRDGLASGSPFTYGQCFELYRRTASVRKSTAAANIAKARRLVGEASEISGPESPRDEAYTFWKERVNAIEVSKLKASTLAAWRKEAIVDHQGSSSAETRKGWLRALTSVFGAEMRIIFSEFGLLGPLPGEGVKVPQPRQNRFRCKMCPQLLLDRARTELRESHPEAYLIFLLAFVMGLRRREIEFLKWSAVDFQTGVLFVSPAHSGENALKTPSSEGQLEIPRALLSSLTEYKSRSAGMFVIESAANPSIRATGRGSYRAGRHSEVLISWLRSVGFGYRSPIHALRKFCGKLIADKHGLEAASLFLRHSSTRVTRQAYIGEVVKHSFGLEI